MDAAQETRRGEQLHSFRVQNTVIAGWVWRSLKQLWQILDLISSVMTKVQYGKYANQELELYRAAGSRSNRLGYELWVGYGKHPSELLRELHLSRYCFN